MELNYKKFSFLFLLLLAFGCKEEISEKVKPIPEEDDEVIELPVDGPTLATDTTLEVMTWNLEFFPLDDDPEVVDQVARIIDSLDVDLIGFQEISDVSEFTRLDNLLTGWEGKVVSNAAGLNLAFLWRTESFSSVSSVSSILTADVSYFAGRPPIMIEVTHTNGNTSRVINLHMKCCTDGGFRRTQASASLKAFLDSEYPNDNVLVIGDYNEEINDSNGAYDNFVEDPDYQFADMAIEQGSSTYWSYPSYPSHIDHILITNELFDNVVNTQTLKLNENYPTYLFEISDHMPVMTIVDN
ncbi:endonuclease/exonuclease/phosphatase family protein [Mangrovivirga sp. M17]|uniref:Endonuclease/exonuclease/phosphatase family protein n=1 Tax=Mangrovivirga halotolerans TaxID=2993936 RepID=A0ABT3RVH4_9BACT|nr:endonuclease/exonuclease/phosphatase family protein [Mangrovivirga halotolerans]MCX2745760.1 endonuclease/exonuclease/phosphatase family protein [Mangrovivirga halotolerans]